MTTAVPQSLTRVSNGKIELLRTHPAWASYWRAGVAAVLVVLLWRSQAWMFDHLLRLLSMAHASSGLGLALGLAPIAVAVLFHRYTRNYEIEGRRKLRSRVGFIARRIEEFSVSPRVQASIEQSVAGRLLDFGTVRFWTGDERSELVWENVGHPTRIAEFFHALKVGGELPGDDPVVPSPVQPAGRDAPSARDAHRDQPAAAAVGPSPELLQSGSRVWVPLPTPHVTVCLIAFDNPDEMRPHEKFGKPTGNFEHDYRHGFRIARWLKGPGDLVSKNEPIAIVDGTRARRNPVLAGLTMPDPVVYAPESGRLVWCSAQEHPRYLFGLIESTAELIEANVDVPLRSDLVPYVRRLAEQLMGIGKARALKLCLDPAHRDYLVPLGGVHLNRNLSEVLGRLHEMCHRLEGPVVPPGRRSAPGSVYADLDVLIERLYRERFDFEEAGLGFLVKIERDRRDGEIRSVQLRRE